MSDRPALPLEPGEISLLIDGLSDDVSFEWALIRLGLRANPPANNVPPDPSVIAAAFRSFERLVDHGLLRLGRIEYQDPDQPPGTYGPVRHVAESTPIVRRRVDAACAGASDHTDWSYACWLVNTDEGDAIARAAIEA